MLNIEKFEAPLKELADRLAASKRILITSPGAADGDSIGAQLALRLMLLHRYPHLNVLVLNDEVLPERYRFLPGADVVLHPDIYSIPQFNEILDLAIIVDGGIDRAGRVRELFERARTTVFIDHHAVSVEFPYAIRIVEPTASATTELIYHLSQTSFFNYPVQAQFAQLIYLGLVFDTGFFRHSNTTPEVMELGAKLLRTGFDFTRVGERGMLERSFPSLKMMSEVLTAAQVCSSGKIIHSQLSQALLQKYQVVEDEREGIIDHLFLIRGIEVAGLFLELSTGQTKLSLRSQGKVDVAKFARKLTEHGGGHRRAAGALLDFPLAQAQDWVLKRLMDEVKGL